MHPYDPIPANIRLVLHSPSDAHEKTACTAHVPHCCLSSRATTLKGAFYIAQKEKKKEVCVYRECSRLLRETDDM